MRICMYVCIYIYIYMCVYIYIYMIPAECMPKETFDDCFGTWSAAQTGLRV